MSYYVVQHVTSPPPERSCTRLTKDTSEYVSDERRNHTVPNVTADTDGCTVDHANGDVEHVPDARISLLPPVLYFEIPCIGIIGSRKEDQEMLELTR
jgi:hypothetical protein